MASTFPAAVDTFSTPTAGSATSSPSHATLHVNTNNAITNAQTYMGMTLISSTTIGTAVSSVTVSSAFSTTYDSYLVALNAVGCSVPNQDLRLRLGLVASTTVTYTLQFMTFGSSTVAGSNATGASGLFISFTENTTNGLVSMVTLHNPFRTVLTRYQADWSSDSYNGVYRGFDNTSTSYTNFMIIPNSGTMTGGTIRVYGYRQ